MKLLSYVLGYKNNRLLESLSLRTCKIRKTSSSMFALHAYDEGLMMKILYDAKGVENVRKYFHDNKT